MRGALTPFADVTLLVQAFDQFAAPEALDVIWLGKIYHDLPNVAEMGPMDIAAVDSALFRALQPGGVVIIVDDAAATGSGFRDTDPDQTKKLHRIDPDVVKAHMRAAGSELVDESKLLTTPRDDHSKSAFDSSIRDHTDGFVLKFRKPR